MYRDEPTTTVGFPSGQEGKRQSEVTVAMDRLEKAVSVVGEASERLGSRMSSVLSPEGPSPAMPDDCRSGRPSYSTELARAIHTRCDHLENIASLLNTFAKRCEL